MLIYLDVCCYNRPFDDQNQIKIHLESEAIMIIFSMIQKKGWKILSSEVIDYEIEQIPDSEKKKKVQMIASSFNTKIEINEAIKYRAKQIHSLGIAIFDAFHIASAEFGKSEYFFTTDMLLVKIFKLNKGFFSKLRIINPIEFIEEVI